MDYTKIESERCLSTWYFGFAIERMHGCRSLKTRYIRFKDDLEQVLYHMPALVFGCKVIHFSFFMPVHGSPIYFIYVVYVFRSKFPSNKDKIKPKWI